MIDLILTILAIIIFAGLISFGIKIIFAAPIWIIVLFFALIFIFALSIFLLGRRR